MKTEYEFYAEKLYKQASAKRIPIGCGFELTSRCNLACRMCNVLSDERDSDIIPRELTADQWIQLASDARDAGLLNLILTGGEVFLRQDFEKIYESIVQMGFRITIYSNASLIGSKQVKWLGKIPPSVMEITIYGASAETYGKLCGNADAYKNVMQAIEMLHAEGINILLRTTVTRYNMEDYDTLAEFSYKRGIPISIVEYLYPSGCSVNMESDCRLDPKSLVDFEYRAYNTNRRLYESYCKDFPEMQFTGLGGKLAKDMSHTPSGCKKKESAFDCDAGSSSFWISWDGHMFPCGTIREFSILPLEIGFRKAWDELGDACSSIPICTDCRSCDIIDYCSACPAERKSETGFYDRPANYLCEHARLYKEKFY